MSRSYELELIDLGPEYYTADEYRDCLRQLGRIGRLMGGDRATLRAFGALQPDSILDVGCGGGNFTSRLAKEYPNAAVEGIDIDRAAIAYAQEHNSARPNLNFRVGKMDGDWDVITATLVCHHLTDEELIDFLAQAVRSARQRVILNDLQRHWIATAAFATLAPLLFRNRLIIHDGLLSIRRAFKRPDLLRLLEAASIPLAACRVTWHLGFRWIIEIDTTRL